MMGLDPRDGRTIVIPERSFQWNPESIQDSLQVGWSEKQIPGGSHALMQWSGNGGRTISFDVILSRHMRYEEDFTIGSMPVGAIPAKADFRRDVVKKYNVEIRAAIAYLRSYCYPEYETQGKVGLSIPPPICLLTVPGTQLNESGGDTIWTVVTGCDVRYRKAFPDGKPRLVTVSMTFRQIVQHPLDGVLYKTRGDLLGRDYQGRGTAEAYESIREILGLETGTIPSP